MAIVTENKPRLRIRKDDDDADPFEQMEAIGWDNDKLQHALEPFTQQIQENMSKTFFCFRQDIKDIKQRLEDQKVPIYTMLGNNPEAISAIAASNRRKNQDGGPHAREQKVDIRIKVVPDEAERLQAFCEIFSSMNNSAKITYAGESAPVLFHKMTRLFFTSRRAKPPQETIDEILAMQDGKCFLCETRLGKKFDIDHILPICLSGTNDIKNLRALCRDCHESETYRLITSGYNENLHYTVESHLPPHLHRELHRAPKPQEVVYGLPWRDRKAKRAKTQNVLDS